MVICAFKIENLEKYVIRCTPPRHSQEDDSKFRLIFIVKNTLVVRTFPDLLLLLLFFVTRRMEEKISICYYSSTLLSSKEREEREERETEDEEEQRLSFLVFFVPMKRQLAGS